MYPKTPGCFSDLSAALYYKPYCFFLKLLIVLPVHFPLLHFTPPKVLRFYYNLTFRCVRYFGGSASSLISDMILCILCENLSAISLIRNTHPFLFNCLPHQIVCVFIRYNIHRKSGYIPYLCKD